MPDSAVAVLLNVAYYTVPEAVVLGGAWLYLRWRDRKLPPAERERLSDIVRRVLADTQAGKGR